MGWQDGCKYEGEFVDDKMHGRGRGACPRAQLRARPWTGPCVGLWQSHATEPLSPPCVRVIGRARWRARARPGVYTWPDGRRYEGEFVAGLSHGRGEVSRTRADFTHTVVYVDDTRLHFEMQRPSK